MIRRSKAQWRALIKAQSESGLSAAELCKREGVTYQTFCARKCDLNPDSDAGRTEDENKIGISLTFRL